MIDQETEAMLKNICPKCNSCGDIAAYFPIVERNWVSIEMACDNCGAMTTITCQGFVESDYNE